MAVKTREDFLSVLQKSGLLNAARLEEAKRLAAALPEPPALAKRLVQQNLISRWQAQELLAGRHALLISKYRLLDLLGKDAVGPIFLAEHTQMDRRVVLKTLARREGHSSAAIDRFLKESAALAALDHRHLSHIYDVDREGDFYYLVMEHVQGRNLQQVVDGDGPMTCEAAAGMVALAADALGHAHQQGILHLGLRPDRLVVDGQGMIKVLDIGVARLAEKESPDGSTIQSEKIAYRAPEQASDAQPDARADVFSLGAVLHLLLTGEAPPLVVEGQPIPDVRKRRRDVPAELAKICQKMIAPKPQDRYASAADAAQALDAWLQQAEAAREAARARATAATPRGGNGEPAAAPRSEGASAIGIALNLDGPTTSGAHPVVVPRKQNNLGFIVIAAGAGVMLLVIGVGAFMLFGNRSAPPPTSRSTAGNPAGGGTTGPVAMTPVEVSAPQNEPFTFQPLKVVDVRGPAEAKFTKRADTSVLVEGSQPSEVQYQVIARCEAPSVTGLKVEVLPHFVHTKQGNEPAKFRLSEIKIEISADEIFTAPKVVKIIGALANNDEPKLSPALAIDGDKTTHWGTNSPDVDRWAIFWFDKPLEGASADKPLWLRATLEQAGKDLPIYQFRLAAVTSRRPESIEAAPSAGEVAKAAAQDVLAYWRFEKSPLPPVAAGGRVIAALDASASKNHLLVPQGSQPPQFAPMAAGAKVRATGEANGQCLDDRKPPAGKAAARGLTTMAARNARDLASQRLETWTVEASFLAERLGFTHAILGKDGVSKAGAAAPLQLRIRGDNDHVEIEAVDSKGVARRVESKKAVVPGRWYHVAAMSDGKQLTLWVDAGDRGGLEQQGTTKFEGALAQGAGEWSVGRGFRDGQPADDAQLLIDEVRINAVALAPPQLLMYATPAELAAEPAAPSAAVAAVKAASGPIKFQPLKILAVEGPEGVEIQPQDDGSFFVTGANPESAVYTLRAHTPLTGIRGIRLEALADSRLPGRGPGRHQAPSKVLEGNFVVSAVDAAATAREAERLPAPINWKMAEADASQDGFDAASLADKNKKGTGWAVAPAVGKGHYVMLTAERPFGYPDGTWLTIKIQQNFGKKFTLGRFRVTVFTRDQKGEDPAGAVLAADKFVNPLSKLPKSVQLPALPAEGMEPAADATTPVTLGEVHVLPTATVELKLLGGETAIDVEETSFHLEPDAKSDEKARRWKITLQSPEAKGDAAPVVAEAAIVGNDLKFRWTGQGAKLPLANHLRNCILDVVAGSDRRGIALREALTIDKVDLGFGRSATTRQRPEIPWLPKATAVKFSLPAKLENFPAYALSQSAAEGGKEKIELVFSEAGQPDLISVIDCSARKSIQIGSAAFFAPNEGKRMPLNRAKVQSFGQQAVRDLQRAKTQLGVFNVPVAQLNPRAKAAKDQLEKVQIPELESRVKQLSRLSERIGEVEKGGGLPVQVYLEWDKERLLLAQSKDE